MWVVEKYEDANVQKFSRQKGNMSQKIYAPIYIGEGRYEIQSILSVSGGFGIIYNAVDKRLGNRRVLIKARRYDNETGLFLFKNDPSRKDKIEKIRQATSFEYDALITFKTGLESRMPNVNDIVEGFCPSIYGPHTAMDGEYFYCEDQDLVNSEPYIIMQMIEGENLGEYVDKGIETIMKEREYKSYHQWERAVLEYAKELATILEGFHRPEKINGKKKYYIYQDLKPDNIMITSDRFITLLDFGGITLVVEMEDGRTKSNYKNLGSPGLGTFGYRAPEMCDPSQLDKLDKRVDVYTLGATIYHLLTGERLNEVLDIKNEQIPVEKLKGKCTDATYELVKKCTELDREKRYADLKEVRTKIVNECFGDVKKKLRT